MSHLPDVHDAGLSFAVCIVYHGEMARARSLSHRYVRHRPGVCGGSPTVEGTRIPVRAIVECVYRLGLTPEEMARKWSRLTLAKIHDALSYYHDHKREIDGEIRRDEQLAGRRTKGLGS